MSRPIMVTCPHCAGLGEIEFTGVYRDTLDLLRKHSSERLTGAELARLWGCKTEAMCNRLRALESMGLAHGTKYGQRVKWEAL